ncbi:peroxisomal multifunctional enzyme [Thraustotheca clavata]|uniref:Peroxisomal multifunctional enzyme n=1 Tax=Thraustotheca clavata TaxID=74557 RepID=A0A1W0A4E6_9STRA|nr:peroxisomal multifunctional enzyme [Thraustotheca clavata]
MLRYDGQVALVTGGAGGLGSAWVKVLSEHGATCFLMDLDARVLEAAKPRVIPIVGDCANEKDGRRVVDEILALHGRIDVLIHAATQVHDAAFRKMSREQWDVVVENDLTSAFNMTRAVWAAMRQQNYGRILLCTSASGLYGNFGQANYATTKSGLSGLTKALGIEGRKYGIGVNAIAAVAGTTLTQSVMPTEIYSRLKPEYTSAIAAFLCHASCSESGGIFEAGGGWVGKVRLERSQGLGFPLNATPEMVAQNWHQVVDFTKATYPESTQDSFAPMLRNVNAPPNQVQTKLTKNIRTIFDRVHNILQSPEGRELVKPVSRSSLQWTLGNSLFVIDTHSNKVLVGSSPYQPDLEIVMTENDFLDFALGTLRLQHAITSKKMTFHGNMMLAMKLTPFVKSGNMETYCRSSWRMSRDTTSAHPKNYVKNYNRFLFIFVMLEDLHVGNLVKRRRLMHLSSVPPPIEAMPELRQTRSEPGTDKVPVHKIIDRIEQDSPPHVAVKYGDIIRLRTKIQGTLELGSVGTYDLASSFFQVRGNLNLNWTTHKCADLACIANLSEPGFHESYFRIVPECYYGHLKGGTPVSYGDVVCLIDAQNHLWNNKVGTAFNGYFGPCAKDSNVSGTMSVAFLLHEDGTDTVPCFQENQIMYYGDTNVVIQVVDSNRLRLGFNRIVTSYKKKSTPPSFGGFLRCDGRGSMLHLEIHGVPPPKVAAVNLIDGNDKKEIAKAIDDMLSTSLSISGPPSATVEILFTDNGVATISLKQMSQSQSIPFYAVVENGQRPVRLKLVAQQQTPNIVPQQKRGISPVTAFALGYLALVGHAYFRSAIVVTSVYGGVVLAMLPTLVIAKVLYLERLYQPLLRKTKLVAVELSVLEWEASQAERLSKVSEDAPSLDVPRRFIVAENGDMVKAVARYADTLAWRDKHGVDALLTSLQPNYHKIRKYYKQGIHKTDKLGHPIFIEKMGSIDIKGLQSSGVTLQDLFKHYLFNMEYILRFVTTKPCSCSSCAESHTCKMLIILDARGLGMRDLAGEALEFVKNCTSVMQKHYPQQSFKIFLVNVPSWFGMIWKCIKPLLNETTRAKTFIVSEAETASALLPFVDPESLPEEYGGTCRCEGGCLELSEFHKQQIDYVDRLDPTAMLDDEGLSDEESDLESSSTDEKESPSKKPLAIMRRKSKADITLQGVIKQDYLLMRVVKHKPFVNPIGLRRLVSLTDNDLCIQKSPKDSPERYALTKRTKVKNSHKPNCFEVIIDSGLTILFFTENTQAPNEWIQAIENVIHGSNTDTSSISYINDVISIITMDLLSSELSADTLAALQAHLAAAKLDEDNDVSEDFRLSQFWYDKKTGDALAMEAMEQSNGGPIAFVSTPAAYKALKAMYPERENVYLFEYDYRFQEKYPSEFAFYDYNSPLEIDAKFHHFFDYVLVDPPYLNTNCMSKFADTMRLLSKEVVKKDGAKDVIVSRNAFITAAVLRKDMFKELGFTPTGFIPSFESKLSNHFYTYTNYTSGRFGKCTENFSDDTD